jgi:hypothetical protein
MQTFAKTPRQETSKERGGSAQQSQSAESSSLRGLMALQRTAGNAAVGQLLRGAIAKAKAEQEAPETQAQSDRESEQAPIRRRERERERERERKENPSGTENDIGQGVLRSEEASPPAEVSDSLPQSEGPIEPDRATVGGSDNQFVSLTQAPASEIVQRIHGGFANDLKDEFVSVRLASAERAPVLRVSLPGDDLAPAKPKAPAPANLPSADRIAVPEGNAEDNLAAEETGVPLQPEGDAVETSVGIAPQIRLDGAAAPGHANAAVTQAASLGYEIQSQIGAEISGAATAAKIRRVGVEREETLEFADSSQSPATQASTEMLEYLATDVPPNVRQMADDDFAPVLDQVLSPARQKVEQATTDRDTQRDQAFAEVVEQTEAASKKANEQQQQAVSDGYDQISAEKQKGLEEGQQTLDTFDAEVKQRHTAHQDEINTKVQTEQEKADDAIRKGEEDARKEEEKAREEERITREEAERDRPEKPKKKWYQKVGDWFKNTIKSWNDKLVNAVKAVFNKAKELVSKVLTFAKNVAVGIIRSLKKFVVAAIKTLAKGLKILVNGLLIAFPKLRARVNAAIDGVVEATVSAVETISQNLEQTVTAAIDRVESTVNRVLDFCEMVIVTQIEIVSAILSGEFLNAAKYLFLAACKAVGIPGEEFLDILADARDGLMDIIKRPAKFLGYMIKSVGQGMKNFFSHFPQRMVAGLTGWLFGQVAQGGITMAKSFDLKSIFVLLIQVMGFTYDYIRAKVISLVGEKAVSVIEQVMTPIRILFTEGPGALWKWLADKAQDAKDAIVEAASQWLITKIIQQAAIKLATMFTPVGAFVQAVLMMYNTIMFFVEKIKEIFAWVKSITSSIKTIATGAISAAANYIDQAMSKSIPLIITFLAKLMGIDGISEKIRQVVTKLRTPVDKAISFVVENLIKLAKSAWGGIKKGATAVKDAVSDWWHARKRFAISTGEDHTLYYENTDAGPILMVASDGEPFDNAFGDAKAKAGKSAPMVEEKRSKTRSKERAQENVQPELDELGSTLQAEEKRERTELHTRCANDDKYAAEATDYPILSMFTHTRHLVPNNTEKICDPFLKDEAKLAQGAQASMGMIGITGAGAGAGLIAALTSAGIVGSAVAAPGLAAGAVTLAGNTLSVGAGALRAARVGANLLYLQHPVLVVEGTSIAVGTIISVDGDIAKIPEAMLTDPANAIFIMEVVVVTKTGGKMPVQAMTRVSRKSPNALSLTVESIDVNRDFPDLSASTAHVELIPREGRGPRWYRSLQTSGEIKLTEVGGRIPKKNGCYVFRDTLNNRVLYVGKAERLGGIRSRIQEAGYLKSPGKHEGAKEHKGAKLLVNSRKDIGDENVTVEFYTGLKVKSGTEEWVGEIGDAASLERMLIEHLKPVHNTSGASNPPDANWLFDFAENWEE